MGMCMMKVVATSIRSLFQQVLFSSEFTIIRDEHACEKMVRTFGKCFPTTHDEKPGSTRLFYACRFQRFSSSALLTTDTELIAIAAPAITGLSMPSIASGMPSTL